MLTKTMLNLFDNIDPLQAEENKIPYREPAGLSSRGKIWQYKNKVTDQEVKKNTCQTIYVRAC